MTFRKCIALPLVVLATLIAGCGGGGGGGGNGNPPDTVAPSVSLTAPANLAHVSGTTTLSAAASDSVGVTRVDYFLDGALLGSSSTAPGYSYSWDSTGLLRGTHLLQAKAADAAGNLGQSTTVSVTVPMTVTMSTVINGTTAVGTVSLHGVAAAEAYGLTVTAAGAHVASAAKAGQASVASNPLVSGDTVILPSAAGFGSGVVLQISFDNLAPNAVPGDFTVSLVAVLDSTFAHIANP